MKRVKLGFTLVEVSIFLVITSAIFVGIAVGTQNSIFQQRYNDTIQNYVEFLRRVYSQVNNVQGQIEGGGRSDKAIYGKLVTYGQKYDLAGQEITDGAQHVFVYDVIGNAEGDLVSGDILKQLNDLDANVVVPDGDSYELVGYPADYTPRWGAEIQTDAGWDDGYTEFAGALLIVRHPSSGKVYTLVLPGTTIEVNEILKKFELEQDRIKVDNLLKKHLVQQEGEEETELFRLEEVNFCINPNGAEKSSLRRDVRLLKGAKNSSSIEIVPDGGCAQ